MATAACEQDFRRSFSKLQHIIEDVVVDGKTVAVRGTLRITHDGEFQGIAPTGKTLDISFMDFARVEDGKSSTQPGSCPSWAPDSRRC